MYRARDSRLGREVAIKVLPASTSSDTSRLYRFEQEARAAAALNHPNILAVHDLGRQDGSPYIVSEFLQGETLRERLRNGPLPLRKAIDYAQQIARGLSAAHDEGIIHRDLKPENIFVTNDGRVKILDFGLAKLTRSDTAVAGNTMSRTLDSDPGSVLGTVGYMSPEQVRGKPLDARSDLFSFGAILYEMLTGKRAFHGESTAETMSAILKEEPPAMEQTGVHLPPALEHIVRHCLEKNPAERFRSAHDVAFALETLSGISDTVQAKSAAIRKRKYLRAALLAAAALIAIVAFWLGHKSAPVQERPKFHRLTFRRGVIMYARFTPDGHTIAYTANWDGHSPVSYSTKPEALGSISLGIPNAEILSISPAGEMLVVLNRHILSYWESVGTLARVPITGGSPRPILEDVQDADWAPDGNAIAVARANGLGYQLEYPIGKVLYQTPGWIGSPRVSPDGRSVAFIDHSLYGDDQGRIAIIDPSGKKIDLTRMWSSTQGLAWAPKGDEVWFTASETGINSTLYAVTPAGKQRLVFRPPGRIMLHDISRDGQVLITSTATRRAVVGLGADQEKERDLNYLDWTRNAALSDDGSLLLFDEQGEGGGPSYSVYVRNLNGSPPTRLGEGFALAFSPDGKSVLTANNSSPPQLFVVPIGAGAARQITSDSLNHGNGAFWVAQGKQIVFNGLEPGHTLRAYVTDAGGGTPKAIAPEGVAAYGPSPDGRTVLLYDTHGKLFLVPSAGGALREVAGSGDLDRFAGWASDGHSVYMYRARDIPAQIYKVDLLTGAQRSVRDFMPSDPAGLINIGPVQVTPDGRHYAYGFVRMLSDLYVVDGFK